MIVSIGVLLLLADPLHFNASPILLLSLLEEVLPQMDPPPNTSVNGSGGSSNGSTEFSLETTIQSKLSIADLADHYIQQLAKGGLTKVDESRADKLVWTSWTVKDKNDKAWRVLFYMIDVSGKEAKVLAVLRAERQ